MATNRTVTEAKYTLPSGTQKSLLFNGTTDFATIPFTPSTSGFSIGMWVQITGHATGKQICSWLTAADTDGFQMKYDTAVRDFVWTTNNGGSFQTSLSTTIPSPGNNIRIMKWTHVVFTYDSTGTRIYVDGLPGSLNASAVMSVATGQSLTLGKNSFASSAFFPGRMKNVTLQNRSTQWTASEIYSLVKKNTIPSGAIQYSMNDNVLDQNGQNGLTLTGTSYSTVVPLKARSVATTRLSSSLVTPMTYLEFRGNYVENYIQPTDISALAIGLSSDYTVGARVFLRKKLNTNNSDNHTIGSNFLNFGSDLGYSFQVDEADGSLKVIIGGNIYTSSLSLVSYNTWTWIIFTLTGTTLKGYVSGSLVWTQTVTRKADDTTITSTSFGRESAGSPTTGRHLFGYYRDIFSTRTLLDQTAITNIVSNGTFPTVDIRYKCDEGISKCVIDYSGNNNHGIIGQDMPLWRFQGRTLI